MVTSTVKRDYGPRRRGRALPSHYPPPATLLRDAPHAIQWPFPQVAATLRAHGEGRFSEPPLAADCAPATSIVSDFAPGTLQVFGGRYCLHRVDPVQGGRDRLIAVLCFASEPGVVNSAAVQQMFWGRTLSVA